MVSMKNLPFQLQGIIHLQGFQFVDLSFKLPCISYRQTFHVISLVRRREANSTCNGEQDTALSPVDSAPLGKLLKFSAPVFYVYWALVMFLDRVARTQLHRWLQARGCDVCSKDAKRAVDKSLGLWWPDTWEKCFKRRKPTFALWFLGFFCLRVFCLYCFVPWVRQSLTGWMLGWRTMLISWSSAGLGTLRGKLQRECCQWVLPPTGSHLLVPHWQS